jgi:hypothetical protein
MPTYGYTWYDIFVAQYILYVSLRLTRFLRVLLSSPAVSRSSGKCMYIYIQSVSEKGKCY